MTIWWFMRDIKSLRLNNQFKRVYKQGKSSVTPYVVLYARPVKGVGGFGITASKKIGKAVERNRAKRRIRGLLRKYKDIISENFDIVAVARTRTIDAPYEKLEEAFLKILSELDLIKEETDLSGQENCPDREKL